MHLLKKLMKKIALFAIICFALQKYFWISFLTPALVILSFVLVNFVMNVIRHTMPRNVLTTLHDKAVLITGCDSGFGHELAKKLDKQGVTVFAGCLFPDGQGAIELKKHSSDRLKILHLDVTKDQHVQAAVSTVVSALGSKKLWAIVNNAGISTTSEIEWTPIEEYQRTLDINTIGPVRITKAFLPLLRKSQGRVVIVASMLGRFTIEGTSAYSMSKHAAVSFADALRKEMLKWAVSVHTIEPYLYRTNLTSKNVIMEVLDKNWNLTPKNVREEYGSKYFEKYKEAINSFLAFGRHESKISEVVYDMVDATIGQNPEVCYRPGFEGQICVWLYQHVPVEAVDFVSYFMKPREVNGPTN